MSNHSAVLVLIEKQPQSPKPQGLSTSMAGRTPDPEERSRPCAPKHDRHVPTAIMPRARICNHRKYLDPRGRDDSNLPPGGGPHACQPSARLSNLGQKPQTALRPHPPWCSNERKTHFLSVDEFLCDSSFCVIRRKPKLLGDFSPWKF